MIKELVKLANHLDKVGQSDLADQLDLVIKMAQQTTETTETPEPSKKDTRLEKLRKQVDQAKKILDKIQQTRSNDPEVKALKVDELKVQIDQATKDEKSLRSYADWIKTTLARLDRIASKLSLQDDRQALRTVFDAVAEALSEESPAATPAAAPAAAPAATPAAATTVAQDVVDKILRNKRGLLYTSEADPKGPIHKMQALLGVTADGKFGYNTLSAYRGVMGPDYPPPLDPNQAFTVLNAKMKLPTSVAPAATSSGLVSGTTAPKAPSTPSAPATTPETAPAAQISPEQKTKVESLEKLLVMIKPVQVYPKGYFSVERFKDIDSNDMREVGNPNGPVSGSVVKDRIKRILKTRYGKLSTKTSSVSETEEKISKIAESLEELSFDFSKISHSVRR